MISPRKTARLIALRESLNSYESIVQNAFYSVNANSLVAGALTAYDLPDLVASLAPRKCVISRPRNHSDEAVDPSVLAYSLKVTFDAYRAQRSGDALLLARNEQTMTELAVWGAGSGL